MTMARRYRVASGGTTLDIVHSHLHLGDGPASAHLATSSTAIVSDPPATQSAPSLTFFTMPSHLLEELWLEVVPTHLDPARAIDAPPIAWPGSASLQCLLEAIDPRFAGRIETLLEVGDGARAPAPRPAIVAAWINPDERAQRVAVRARNGAAAIVIAIAAGEGCVWEAALLDVAPAPPESDAEPQIRVRISAY